MRASTGLSRRDVLLAVASVAVAGPARSDTDRPLIGVLTVAGWSSSDSDELVRELRRRGYAGAGRIRFVVRNCGTQLQQLDAMAAELVAMRVNLLLAEGGTPTALAARRATTAIPIVMSTRNPIEDGLVESLAKPGGNVTGSADIGTPLMLKRLQLLLAAVEPRGGIGYLTHPTLLRRQSERDNVAALEAFMRSRGSSLVVATVREVARGDDLDHGFSAFDERRVGGVLINNYATIGAEPPRVADVCLRRRLPAIMETRGYAASGVLMTYSEPEGEGDRRRAGFVQRILEGARPRDLPIEQPQRFELVINQRTAKSLGLAIPRALLVQADEIIG